MSEAEAAEIAEEVATETAEISAEVTEAMEVVSEASEVTENTIDVSAEVDEALQAVNEESLSGIVEDTPSLSQSIESEASAATESLVDELQESGVISENLPAEAGSRFSLTESLVRAGRTVLQNLKGLWTRLGKVAGIGMKFAEIYMVIDFIGRKVLEIIDTIEDATKNPPWKGSLTEEQKKQIKLLQDAVSTMKPLYEGLEEAVKKLKDNIISYGTILVKLGSKEEKVEVIDVVAHLIMDGLAQMQQAQDSMKDGIDGLTVMSLTQLSNNIFNVFANIQAMIDLRDNKNNLVKDDQLKMFKFPPAEVDKTTNDVLSGDFPQWKEKVNSQGYNLAVMGASISTGAFVQSQVIMKVNAYLRMDVYPVIKKAAKDAGVAAAKDYVSSQKAKIIAEALIPVVGTELAKKLGEKVKNEAIEKAKEAAKAAGQRKATVLKRSMAAQIKPIVDEVMKANKEQMELIAKYAAQQMMDMVVPPDQRKDDRSLVALPAGVTQTHIGLVRI